MEFWAIGTMSTPSQGAYNRMLYVDLLLALEDRQGITQVIRINPLGTMNICPNFCANLLSRY